MAVSFKIDPIDRDIALMLAPELAPAGRSKALAAFAREQLADAQAINRKASGVTPPHETYVDGSRGAVIEGVKPDGTIVFEFDLVLDVLEWIREQLVKHSPVLTGEYSRSHVLFANGREVSAGEPIPPAAQYVFLNVQPYARKLEGDSDYGRKGGSDQAPDGVYQAVSALAYRRFGNVAKVEYGYSAFYNGVIASFPGVRAIAGRLMAAGMGENDAKREASLRRKRHSQRRQPAIFVSTG